MYVFTVYYLLSIVQCTVFRATSTLLRISLNVSIFYILHKQLCFLSFANNAFTFYLTEIQEFDRFGGPDLVFYPLVSEFYRSVHEFLVGVVRNSSS